MAPFVFCVTDLMLLETQIIQTKNPRQNTLPGVFYFKSVCAFAYAPAGAFAFLPGMKRATMVQPKRTMQ